MPDFKNPSFHEWDDSSTPDVPMPPSEIPLRLEAPIEVRDDHVLTALGVYLDLLIDIFAPHRQLGQGEIPIVVAVLHKLIHTIVGLCLGLALKLCSKSSRYARSAVCMLHGSRWGDPTFSL